MMHRGPVYSTVEIVEQPVEEYRFRYEIESRTNGSIPGVSSTPARRTYPAIRVNGYGVGQHVMILVSCVAKDPPYRPHPFKLVGRTCCGGVYRVKETLTEDCTIQLRNIGIQCVKKSLIQDSLALREEQRIDPFRTGFDPRATPSLGMHHVRLAVQVFAADCAGKYRVPVGAVCTNVISDQTSRLHIVYNSHPAGSARGGTQLVLLTEKLTRNSTNNNSVRVRFEEPSTNWIAESVPIFVHKMCVLVLSTPPYRDPDTPRPATVVMYLYREPTAGVEAVSNLLSFEYTPEPQLRKRPLVPQPASKRPRTVDKPLHVSLIESGPRDTIESYAVFETEQECSGFGDLPANSSTPDNHFISIDNLTTWVQSQPLYPYSIEQPPVEEPYEHISTGTPSTDQPSCSGYESPLRYIPESPMQMECSPGAQQPLNDEQQLAREASPESDMFGNLFEEAFSNPEFNLNFLDLNFDITLNDNFSSDD